MERLEQVGLIGFLNKEISSNFLEIRNVVLHSLKLLCTLQATGLSCHVEGFRPLRVFYPRVFHKTLTKTLAPRTLKA